MRDRSMSNAGFWTTSFEGVTSDLIWDVTGRLMTLSLATIEKKGRQGTDLDTPVRPLDQPFISAWLNQVLSRMEMNRS